MRRRRADFVADLVVYDEPHLSYYKSRDSSVIAVAICPVTENGPDFFAATVSPKNWERYRQGSVDLRYLLAFAAPRTNYTFKSVSIRDGSVMMDQFVKEIPEEYLPAPGLFSDAHTEPFDLNRVLGETEDKLFIDGEWAVNEFGNFYQRYSDLYFFSTTVSALSDSLTDINTRNRIKKAFTTRPFQGGGSYVQLFDDFEGVVPRQSRLALEGISYNSPGTVRVSGAEDHLVNVEGWIRHFLNNRHTAIDLHKDLRGYLAKRKLLRASARSYDGVDKDYLFGLSRNLYNSLGLDEADRIAEACDYHPLVFAKVVLSLFRRISGAASFFAEGRMSFVDPQQA